MLLQCQLLIIITLLAFLQYNLHTTITTFNTTQFNYATWFTTSSHKTYSRNIKS